MSKDNLPNIPAIIYVTTKSGTFTSRRLKSSIREYISKQMYLGKRVPFFYQHFVYEDLKSHPTLSPLTRSGVSKNFLPIFVIEFNEERKYKNFKSLKELLDFVDLLKFKAHVKVDSTIDPKLPSLQQYEEGNKLLEGEGF